MTDRTPGPWEVKDDHLVIEPGLMTTIADCAMSDDPNEPMDDVMQRANANAEFIKRAENAYDDLVKPTGVLEMAILDIDMGISLLDEYGTDPEAWLDSARQRLRDALQKARS